VASSECDAEHSEQVAIHSLGLHEGFNGGVPLLDQGAKLVSRDVDAVEVRVAVESLHLFALHLHLPPGLLVGVIVQISQGYLENATSQTVGGNFLASRLVSWGERWH